MTRSSLMLASLCVVASTTVVGCNQVDMSTNSITVESTDLSCRLATSLARAGTITFSVTNKGNKPTGFYLYGQDGQKVVGSVGDIDPGATRQLIVDVNPGTYVSACKPGMTGDGIRAPFVVS